MPNINLNDAAQSPKLLDKLILDHARHMNDLLKLAFKAMHAPVPDTALCGWLKDKEKYCVRCNNETITLTDSHEEDMIGLPYIGGAACV